MSNTNPENQIAYYQEHPPKCITAFLAEPEELGNFEFDGHGFSGSYPDGLVANPNTFFAIRCHCGGSVHRIVGESEEEEIRRHKNLMIAEKYFLECDSCHLRHLFFDPFSHGYDAETSRIEGINLHEIVETEQSLPRNEKVTYECCNCGNTTFEVFTRFEYPPDLFDEPLFAGREQEFFSWFTGIGKCTTCSSINVFMEHECS